MIVGIVGEIEKKEPTYLHILSNGLIYEVFVSLQCSGAVKTKEIKLFTSHIIREDAQILYGFLDINEKKMFERLIKINGVGPKVAMAICSTFTPQSFLKVVEQKDIGMLKRVPGIGPKSAGRILVELGGFVIDMADESPQSKAHNEALLALESLGFKKESVSKILRHCVSGDTQSLIKEALKKLGK